MNVQMKAKRQKGFTIIELVVVILLLGILAATALPRFLDVTEEAHDAVVQGTASALQTGMALYRAQWIAQQQPAAGEPLTDAEEFSALKVATSGYPIALESDTASTSTLSSNATCEGIYNGMLQAGRVPVQASEIAAADTLASTDLEDGSSNAITEGFVAKLIESDGADDFGDVLSGALSATDEFCVYLYAADASRRTIGTDVPAIMYFPLGTSGGTGNLEAGTVIQTIL